MTNYNNFPKWRAFSGITIKFAEFSYSWCDDNKSNRKYLLTSDYLRNAVAIYLGWAKRWFTVEEYLNLIQMDDYTSQKSIAIERSKKEDEIKRIKKAS